MGPPRKKKRKDTNNILECLPEEILVVIFKFVNLCDLCSLSLTCKKLHQITRNPVLWTDIVIDWISIKQIPNAVHSILSRSRKIVNLQIRNKTCEKVNSQLIISTVKLANDTLKSLSFSLNSNLELASSSVAKLGEMSNLTSLEVEGSCFNAKVVNEIAKLCNLERFIIPGACNLKPKDLIYIFSRLRCLKMLDISSCVKGLNDSAAMALAQSNPHLVYLNFDDCELITEKGLKEVAENCPKLFHISLNGCYQVNDFALVKIATRCCKLSHVSLAGCKLITDAGLKQLGLKCPNMKQMNLFGCSMITEQEIARLLKRSKYLEYICIKDIEGVSRTFSENLEKLHPNIKIRHSFQLRQKAIIRSECRRAPLRLPTSRS